MSRIYHVLFVILILILVSGCAGNGQQIETNVTNFSTSDNQSQVTNYSGHNSPVAEFVHLNSSNRTKKKQPNTREILVANSTNFAPNQKLNNDSESVHDYQNSMLDNSNCEGSSINFSYPPVNLDKIIYILPLGGLSGEHVTPIDHQYYQNFNNEKIDIEVYTPADGVITNIQHMGSFRGDDKTRDPFDDYRLVIKHSCTISTIFIHIDKLSPKIMEGAPKFGENSRVNIKVVAGEVIGLFDDNVDFNVVDKDYSLEYINPSSYISEPNRAHIQDPFVYYVDPIKSQLIAKSLRSDEPVGGILDYDIDGTLQGTWFKKGTNGWAGLVPERYWADHLAIVPHNLDPESFLFSVGTYNGRSRQFAIKGNEPNPSKVILETGLIKYELVNYRLYNKEIPWDFGTLIKGLKVRGDDQVQGVVLMQIIDDQTLKVEIFPDKTANQVNGFSSKVHIYER